MKGIIFDLDGTLIDSMTMYRSLSKNYLRKFDIELDEDVAHKLTVMDLATSINYLIDYYDLKKDPIEVYNDYQEMIIDFYSNRVEFKEAAEETLKHYIEKGYTLALGTATQRHLLAHVFKRLELEKYFDYIQSVEDIEISKSKREFFDILAQKMGIENQEIMVYDDAPYALVAAKEAGMQTTAVYDVTAEKAWEDIKAKNDYHIKSFKEVLNK